MNPASQDLDHLRLLSVFHYVVGGMTAFFACFPLIHLTIGIAMLSAPNAFGTTPAQQPPPFVGWIFAAIGGLLFVLGQSLAVAIIFAGRFLNRRVRYTYCVVVACVECLFMPFGTALGVFTIIVLLRPSVRPLFEGEASLGTTPGT